MMRFQRLLRAGSVYAVLLRVALAFCTGPWTQSVNRVFALTLTHKKDQIIIGKIWLIGRTYAAAIERRRTTEGAIGDNFYESEVAPKIRKSEIDNWFEAIRNGNSDDLTLHLEVHARVLKLFTEISGIEKRSLASKYLHFHFPERFFIYDSRANKVICELTKPVGKRPPALGDHDEVYTRFFIRCRDLGQRLDAQPLAALSVARNDAAAANS